MSSLCFHSHLNQKVNANLVALQGGLSKRLLPFFRRESSPCLVSRTRRRPSPGLPSNTRRGKAHAPSPALGGDQSHTSPPPLVRGQAHGSHYSPRWGQVPVSSSILIGGGAHALSSTPGEAKPTSHLPPTERQRPSLFSCFRGGPNIRVLASAKRVASPHLPKIVWKGASPHLPIISTM